MSGSVAFLAACQQSITPTVTTTGPPSEPPARIDAPGSAVAPAQMPANFEAWLGGVRRDALQQGIGSGTLDLALAGIAPIPRVIELDRRQPEFTQTFWRYLDGAVSAKRVETGRARLREHAGLLRDIERAHGVPARFLVAFWGLETNFGSNLGGFYAIAALATLAYDGRRSAFFRGELMAALRILDQGHVTPSDMKGSWAGAMGQTQFMPSTFLKHAIDADHDGRINPWQSTADALGSGANYLRNLGWDGARTWGREVTLPSGFDVRLASIDTNAADVIRPLSAWAALGVRRADGAALPTGDLTAALILPSGAQGQAFLVYENFRAILKWNRSTFYAVAIGHLADRITGGAVIAGKRSSAPPMSRDDVLALQQALSRRGYLGADGVDGVVGAATRRAIRSLQIDKGLPADGYVDSSSLPSLMRSLAA